MSRYAVAIQRQDRPGYPETPPYHPPARYPEFSGASELDPTNTAYAAVRDAFALLGMDRGRFGTAAWNPLGTLVRPGNTVFLKPNMIAHTHTLRDEWDSLITHGSVIRAVVDYVHLALKGEGAIWLGDAPQTDSHWDQLMDRMGLGALQAYYRASHGFEVEVLDLRDEHYVEKDGIYVETVALPGDPRGSVAIDLAHDSMFRSLDAQGKRYYGAYYDWKETNAHQRAGRHEYAISKSPLMADVFISLPKLKTHKKCGITVNLKGLVGINANKNWLPHYAFGGPSEGGDQFDRSTLKSRIENLLVVPIKELLLTSVPLVKSFARRTKRMGYDVFGNNEEVVRSGNWHGNDTVWRMCLDLNRILTYGAADGSMRPAGQGKRWFSVVDGIVAMEGNGPQGGDRRAEGLVIAGDNPVAVDAVCARLMGFDPQKLALVRAAFEAHRWPLIEGGEADIAPASNVAQWSRPLSDWSPEDALGFKAHFGWSGTMEWKRDRIPTTR